ncbi:PAS domain S-box-containing protein/diguanylate cyclase (GGDEF) domain-containing protein [Halomonas sp. HL-93]|nr:MAG: GGDEF domain protein [Halomonas sp. HL-93]SBR49931.1 PAS domain S-box-containing protein/diguanylate cyclase (GGDEF) domain-containing protein [Halomonas sp. HL-93]SNY96602.1 PAS domain S-box-containing protein/diguanylate cyclase (GGDEF) domain-containing protein [Halomonas sp. hl-4]
MGLAVTWLLVVMLVLGMAWQLGSAMVKATNMAHLRYESTLLADEVTEQVDARIDALSRLNTQLEADASDDAIDSTLQRNEALMAWFEGVVVANAEGRVIADWPNVEGREGLDTAQLEYFKILRGSQKPYVSEPFVGRGSGMPMILISVPRIDQQGNFNGFVGGVVSLDSGGIFDRLSRVRLGEQGYAGVATASGKILYHPNRDLIMTEVPDSDFNPWLGLALDGWEGEAVGALLNGQLGFQSYGQVWPANWVVGLYLPSEQAQEPLGGFLKRLWWLGVALTLLMLPVLWLILRRMLSPLKHLAKQIGQVGRGERERVQLGTNLQELQRVAHTFNRVEDERQVLMANLQEREAFLDSVLNATPQGMFVANFDGDITYMNPSLLDMLGIQSDAPTNAWLHQIHHDDRGGAIDMWKHSLKTGSDFVRQFRFVRSDNETLWLDVHARVVMLSQGGHSLGLVGVVKDITERREQEAIQRWEAEHDPLTGLLNRRGFERRLDDAFAEFQKTSTPSALLLFDLDHFKPINDEGGHALGDEMLRRIAQVVAWEVRRSDHVARQGGDEFGVLLPSCTLNQAQKIAESLCQSVGEISVVHEGKEYSVTLSIGVTTFHEDDGSTDEALARADAGSYAAKDKGRNGVVIRLHEEHSPSAIQLFE